MKIYTDMFLTFAKIGAFTLGGGYAMIPLLEKEVVDRKGWLSKKEFMDVLAISQSTPGLFAINMASHIGNKLNGVWGGMVGSFGVALPSIVVILLIAMFFQTFKDNPLVEKFFMGVRPAVVALIVTPCIGMAKTARLTMATAWIPIVACVLIALFGVSPIWIVCVALISGYVLSKVQNEK